MKIRLLGTRGSIPSPTLPGDQETKIIKLLGAFKKSGKPLRDFIGALPRHQFGGYGGNTPCVEINTSSQQVVIDGGSGLRQLGIEMMKGPCGQGKGEVHLFFTHFHWDHLIGLPFFIPLFIPGNQLHFYAVQKDLKKVFQTLFKKPFFPVPLASLASTIHYHKLAPRKTYQLNDINITPYQLDHPDPCWGYKVQSRGRNYAHCVDTECVRMSRTKLGLDLPLYQGIDLMLFDSQYTLSEMIGKISWGHSAAPKGLDLAIREGIKKVVFIHHDPAAGDKKLANAELETKKYYQQQIRIAKSQKIPFQPIEWCFGYDGMTIEL